MKVQVEWSKGKFGYSDPWFYGSPSIFEMQLNRIQGKNQTKPGTPAYLEDKVPKWNMSY